MVQHEESEWLTAARLLVASELPAPSVSPTTQAEVTSLSALVEQRVGQVIAGVDAVGTADVVAVNPRDFALHLLDEWAPYFTEHAVRLGSDDGANREESHHLLEGPGSAPFAALYGGLVIRLSELVLDPLDLPLPLRSRRISLCVDAIEFAAVEGEVSADVLLTVVVTQAVIRELLFSDHDLAARLWDHVYAYATGCGIDFDLFAGGTVEVVEDASGHPKLAIKDADAYLGAIRPVELRGIAAQLDAFSCRLDAVVTLVLPNVVSWIEPLALQLGCRVAAKHRTGPSDLDLHLRGFFGLGTDVVDDRSAVMALQANRNNGSLDALRRFVREPLVGGP